MRMSGLAAVVLLVLSATTARAAGGELVSQVAATLEGDELRLGARGWARLRLGDNLFTCVNAGELATVVEVHATASPPLRPQAEAARCVAVAAASATDDRLGLFVLDLRDEVDDAELALVATRLVTGELSGHRRLRVASGEDVRRLLQMQESRALAGCRDPECVADLAGALDARYLVTGSLSREGRALRLDLSLSDTEAATTVAREVVLARDDEDLAARTGTGVRNLLAELLDHERSALPPPELGRRMEEWSAVRASLLVAAAAAGAGLLLMPAALGIDLLLPQIFYATGGLGLGLTTVLAALATAAAVWIGDAWAGAQLDWRRLFLTVGTATVAVAVLGALALVGALVVQALVGFASGLPDPTAVTPDTARAFFIGFASLNIVAALLSGATAGATYDLAIGVLGDAPAGVRWEDADVE